MTDSELEDLRRAATSHRDDIVIQLGGNVGFHAFEIPQIRPKHVNQTEDDEHYAWVSPRGTTPREGGKALDVYLPGSPNVTGFPYHRSAARTGRRLPAPPVNGVPALSIGQASENDKIPSTSENRRQSDLLRITRRLHPKVWRHGSRKEVPPGGNHHACPKTCSPQPLPTSPVEVVPLR